MSHTLYAVIIESRGKEYKEEGGQGVRSQGSGRKNVSEQCTVVVRHCVTREPHAVRRYRSRYNKSNAMVKVTTLNQDLTLSSGGIRVVIGL